MHASYERVPWTGQVRVTVENAVCRLYSGLDGLPLARDVVDAYSGRGGKSRARARYLEIKIAKHSTLETQARVSVSKVFIV